ncbi:MAG: helix-turn-helix domain-containing protein, partial [Ruminiclostridium sp.]|nr:helix-turn-helix domain-containing protein [Ruminiclostridium sp.]
DLSHYYNLVQKTADSYSGHDENLMLFFDFGENLAFKVSEVQGNKPPETVIHAVRVMYGYNRVVRGAVIVTVSGDIFKSFLSKHAPESLGSVFIVNKDGNIISHTDSSIIGHNVTELGYEELLNQNDGNGYYVENTSDGLPAVFSYQTSLYNDWMYVSVAPIAEISSFTNYILKLLIIVALISIAVGVLASFSRARMLARPMKNIVNNIKKSPYYSNQTKENNEYSLINSTINNMENIMKEKEVALQKVLPMIRMNFLSALFSSNPPDISEINARMRMMDIEFLHKFFCVAVVKLDKLQESEKVVLYEYEKLQICSKLEETFTTNNSICLYYEKDNTIKVLVNFDFEESILYKLGEEFFNETQKLSSEGISISKYMSFGKTDTNLQHMNTSHKIAMNGLNYSYVFPEKYLFTFDDIINLEEKRSYSNRLLLNNLSNSLKSLNCEKSIVDIENLISNLRGGSFSYQQIYTTLSSCVSLVEDFLTTHVGQDIDLEIDFRNTINILEYEIWIKKVIHKAFSDIVEADSNNNIIVIRAQEFIKDNIQNPQLSLEYVAQELDINYKYLSRVFKNETGIKFIDYVTNLKLNHCRNLLINTNLKVEEISDIMKYSSPQYFISRFKMMFGYTPKQYRENYLEGQNLDGKLIVE